LRHCETCSLLDFSRAMTGNLFFVPSATFLENVAEDP
jgi:porphyrinogen peroxidase